MSSIDYIICIPVLKVSDTVKECLDSIRDTNVLLIDNSGKNECNIFEKYGFKIEYQKENIGNPRSYNIALKKNHDWTFIVSSSVIFNKPFSHIVEMINDSDEYILRTTLGWHCNGINKKLVDLVGYFDENFYPAYFDTADWDHRVGILGIDANLAKPSLQKWPRKSPRKIDAFSKKAHACVEDHKLKVNLDALNKYFRKKWGGDDYMGGWGEYLHPFNDQTKTIKYWEENSIDILKNKYNL